MKTKNICITDKLCTNLIKFIEIDIANPLDYFDKIRYQTQKNKP